MSVQDHLRDTDFQIVHVSAFVNPPLSYLPHRSFTTLISRKQMDQFVAFSQMQRELLDLAHAHIERMILERFARVIATVHSQPLKPVLKRACDLFALSQIESNKGWYLEHGALTGLKSRAVTQAGGQTLSRTPAGSSAICRFVRYPGRLCSPDRIGRLKMLLVVGLLALAVLLVKSGLR